MTVQLKIRASLPHATVLPKSVFRFQLSFPRKAHEQISGRTTYKYPPVVIDTTKEDAQRLATFLTAVRTAPCQLDLWAAGLWKNLPHSEVVYTTDTRAGHLLHWPVESIGGAPAHHLNLDDWHVVYFNENGEEEDVELVTR